MAHEDIEPTADWQKEIESALRTMDSLLALVTPGFRESAWADQEVGFAIGRGKLVVPLKVDGQDPHGFIARHQAISVLRGETPPIVGQKIYLALRNHEATQDQLAMAVVAQLEDSTSWESASKSLEQLEQFVSLGQDLLKRLKKVHDSNNAIKVAPESFRRINALLSRHNFSGQPLTAPIDEGDIPF